MGVMEEAWGLDDEESALRVENLERPYDALRDGELTVDVLREQVIAKDVERTEHMRHFPSGATRNSDDGKFDYEGYLSPEVLEQFARYMYRHGATPEGRRASDNWQKGFGYDVLMKSLLRHVFDLWLLHRSGDGVRVRPNGERVEYHDALGGALFNVMALWNERLNNGDPA